MCGIIFIVYSIARPPSALNTTSYYEEGYREGTSVTNSRHVTPNAMLSFQRLIVFISHVAIMSIFCFFSDSL
jgi:hypothetical protein